MGATRVPQDVRAAVGDGLVDDVPDLDLALVAADNGGNMIVHPLEQLLAGRAWAVKAAAAETAAKTAAASAAAGRIRPGRVCGVGRPGGRLVPRKTQLGVWPCQTRVCPTIYM